MSIMFLFFFLMSRPPPRLTRTDTLFPYTTLFRSVAIAVVSRDGHLGTTPPAFLLFSEWNRTPPVESDGNYGDAPLADFEEPVQPRLVANAVADALRFHARSEEHTSALQSLMRISYAVFCLKKKNKHTTIQSH